MVGTLKSFIFSQIILDLCSLVSYLVFVLCALAVAFRGRLYFEVPCEVWGSQFCSCQRSSSYNYVLTCHIYGGSSIYFIFTLVAYKSRHIQPLIVIIIIILCHLPKESYSGPSILELWSVRSGAPLSNLTIFSKLKYGTLY